MIRRFHVSVGLPTIWCAVAVLQSFDASSIVDAADGVVTAEQRDGYQQHALTHQGDAKRGAKLFADAKRTRCAICHRVGGKGGEVGPDLSRIGGKFDRPHLIESLLEPSRQIVEVHSGSINLCG